MTESFENFHLPNGSDWEAIFLLFGINSLQRNNFSCFLMRTDKYAPLESKNKQKKKN